MSRLFALIVFLCARLATAQSAHDFNRDIRPILSNNCFKCHGIDENARKAKLRLDVRDGALAPAKSGKVAIVPGKPDESELIKRILTNDEDDVMPPPATKKVLTAQQKDLLKRWIAAGAEYKEHWAFVAPKQASLPAVKHNDWLANPIDYFVLAALEAKGLAPSPPADKYALVRRVYLDLIGLPPTPQEADAFVKDDSPQAFEKLVDRLLASPQYGERWARRWLDLARYADTNGYEKDRPRVMWPYRDWVINALNKDMPFDQFTVEQLAGDMLPNATADQKIATGFHRNTMTNEEGGIDPLEYRFHAMVDRVGTTGTTWLGMSIACAQCHTHKYDPITQREYYGLMACLDNANEPEMAIPSADIAKKRAEIEAKIEKLESELAEKYPVGNVKWTTPIAKVTTAGESKAEAAGDAWRFSGTSPDKDTFTFVVESTGPVDRVRIEMLREGNKGPGRTEHGNFVLSEITASVAPKDSPEKKRAVKFVRAKADHSQQNFNIAAAIDGNPQQGGWAIDGAEYKNRTATFYFDKPVDLPAGVWTITLSQNHGGQHTIGKMRLSLGGEEKIEGDLAKFRKERMETAFAAWVERESKSAVKWTMLRPKSMKSSTPILTLLDDGSVLASGDITKLDTYDLEYDIDVEKVAAIRLEALPHPSLPKDGPGMVYYEGPMGDFQLSEITVKLDGADVKLARAKQSYSAGGMEAAKALDGNQQTGWMINGGQGKAHYAVFSPEQAASGKRLALRMLFEKYYAAALGRFRISVTSDPRAGGGSILPPEVEDALATPAESRSVAQKDTLLKHWLLTTPELGTARQPIDQLRKSIPKETTALVMSERPAGFERKTHLHHRGEFLSSREEVTPTTPAVFPAANGPMNRLSFAKWLVSRENPLTARVTVNRAWAAFFGRGIVRTTEDFGFQGELPSNQDLLDWLAVEFMNQGWSQKKLHRLIVTSSAYRQSSRVTPELLAKDPANVLISRGPRVRLEAEMIRDGALKVAGLLSSKIGGPSVFPPQIPSITTEGAYGPLQWNVSTGEDRYRRSLYTFAKRTAPFAMYNTFDGPSGEACVARREVSNTPLQALTLLNDQIFVEASQALGRTIARVEGNDEVKAAEVFRRILTRPADQEETAAMVGLAKSVRARVAAKEIDAMKIAGAGEGEPAERAVWTVVVRGLMNLDEFVVKN
jgi:hypothetical protein